MDCRGQGRKLRDDGKLNKGGSTEDSEKWSTFRYVLKVKSTSLGWNIRSLVLDIFSCRTLLDNSSETTR